MYNKHFAQRSKELSFFTASTSLLGQYLQLPHGLGNIWRLLPYLVHGNCRILKTWLAPFQRHLAAGWCSKMPLPLCLLYTTRPRGWGRRRQSGDQWSQNKHLVCCLRRFFKLVKLRCLTIIWPWVQPFSGGKCTLSSLRSDHIHGATLFRWPV